MDRSELKELNEFCKFLTNKTSAIIKNYYNQDISIEIKEDLSPVTIADQKAEEFLRESILSKFPDHGIIGEEFGNYNENSTYTWVLDPIDGTKSFICGVPLFGTLVALLKNGEPVIGVIQLPILNEFLFGNNFETTLNDSIVKIRSSIPLQNATLLSTDHLDNHKHQKGANFEALVRKIKLYRTWGDCFGYYLLATGKADIMIDPIMSYWDSMALVPIVRGAGGVITNYEGIDPVINSNSIVAAGSDLHPQILSILNNQES